MGGSGGSACCTLTNAFVPFSAKDVTGRNVMKGNEDEFVISRNASASQLVSFSSNQLRGFSLGGWDTQLPWERRETRGYLQVMENRQKVEGINIQYLTIPM